MILYFGDPAGALQLLARDLPLAGVIHGRRGGAGWSTLLPKLKALGTPRWTLPDLDDPATVAAFAALKPTLIVSAFYPRRIPKAVLDLAPGINVHPSDLPRWRGPDPTFWTLRSGDATTAVCVHQLTEGLDEGDILGRWPTPVGAKETAGGLSARLEAEGAARIAEVAARVLAGQAPTPTPQTGEVTWAPQVPGDDLEIDWSVTAAEVDQLVRASAPYPGAFTGLEDELMVVLSGKPVSAERFEGVPPGSLFIKDHRVHLRCGEGAYALHRIKVGKRSMTGVDLARLLTG